MRRQPVAVAIAVIALAVLVVLGGVTGSTAARVPPPRLATAPITSATLVCPTITGAAVATSTRAIIADVASALSPPSQSTGTVTATVLARKKSTKTPLSLAPAAAINSRPKVSETVSIGATGSVAASLVADQIGLTSSGRYRGLSSVGCVAPATDWWFVAGNGFGISAVNLVYASLPGPNHSPARLMCAFHLPSVAEVEAHAAAVSAYPFGACQPSGG
jgi:hypothetical protein